MQRLEDVRVEYARCRMQRRTTSSLIVVRVYRDAHRIGWWGFQGLKRRQLIYNDEKMDDFPLMLAPASCPVA